MSALTNQTILKEQKKLAKQFAGLEKLLLQVVGSFEIGGKKRKSNYRPKIKCAINSKADAHAHIERKFSKPKTTPC